VSLAVARRDGHGDAHTRVVFDRGVRGSVAGHRRAPPAPGLDHATVLTLAAGGIAGESIMGVVIAGLNAAGVL